MIWIIEVPTTHTKSRLKVHLRGSTAAREVWTSDIIFRRRSAWSTSNRVEFWTECRRTNLRSALTACENWFWPLIWRIILGELRAGLKNIDFLISFNSRILNHLKDLTLDTIAENKRNFLSLLMTCCDLSDQARPWATNEHVAVS